MGGGGGLKGESPLRTPTGFLRSRCPNVTSSPKHLEADFLQQQRPEGNQQKGAYGLLPSLKGRLGVKPQAKVASLNPPPKKNPIRCSGRPSRFNSKGLQARSHFEMIAGFHLVSYTTQIGLVGYQKISPPLTKKAREAFIATL